MKLLILCWAAYFSTYIGRLNYSASLNAMLLTEHFTKSQAGMIGTGFFLAYGGGQFISGFLGDRLPPKYMVFTGLASSAVCNAVMAVMHDPLPMTVIWSINGLAQAFIWSPLLRVMFEYYDTETRVKACVSLNSSVPIGTMAAYGFTAAAIRVLDWRYSFGLAAVLLAGMALIWLCGMTWIERHMEKRGMEVQEAAKNERAGNERQAGKSKSVENGRQGAKSERAGKDEGFSWKHMLVDSGLCLLLPALFIQGVLKDGVTTWAPTYVSETSGMDGALAVACTMIIPVFNLTGIYAASYVNLHFLKQEIRTATAFFGVSAAALLTLYAVPGRSAAVSFLMLAIATTAMMAVNTMLIAVLPSYFGVMGRASSVSGILNSTVYVGGAASTYGIGALSMTLGWNGTLLIWLGLAVLAVVFCMGAIRKWERYRLHRFGHSPR